MPADKPAATVHGTGSGEALDELCPRCHDKKILHTSGGCMAMDCSCSLIFVPTPPASPTVTLDRETTDHVRDYILPVYESRAKIMAAVSYHDFAKDKCRCGGCWLYRQLERLGDALALLRAAEQK